MGRFLETCILSVLLQNYPHCEHIVVDGDSQDDTREILKRYPHIKWVSEPDRGLPDALNKGIRMATGDIIGSCNADDLYLPGTLHLVNEYFETHPELDVLYGDYRETDEMGRSRRIVRETHFSPFVLRWLHMCLVPCPSAFWRKRIHDTGIWFDVELQYAMDYEFFRKALDTGCRFQHISVLLSDFRRHPGSKTTTGHQQEEHELIIRRDPGALQRLPGVLFPIMRSVCLVAARAVRTIEKLMRGFYIEQVCGR
jgi:glycosyltransferase involved in cell wall biosynthesis